MLSTRWVHLRHCLIFVLFIDLQKASEYSRKMGLPRFYLSANSGARIGLAEEIKHLFNVAWEDAADPDKVTLG